MQAWAVDGRFLEHVWQNALLGTARTRLWILREQAVQEPGPCPNFIIWGKAELPFARTGDLKNFTYSGLSIIGRQT